MRTKRVVMLACPALLSALAFGAASPASAAPSPAKTTVTSASAVVPDPDMSIAKPPKKRAAKAQYRRGYNSGYMEGRSDCKLKKPYNITMSGGGAYGKGFRHGYTTGFHSCTPPA
ncbi:hypothetical protein ABT294_11510 [Nonomuraea sp. NPDC000554]|uniref:hypothetical protein n=1 Tax=Nonomuraea sp. NPDC000554 TaxID=3154259 RepID=UPI00332123F0